MKRSDYLHWDHFKQVDMRIGTVVEALPFPEAKKPAIQLKIDFGDLGILKSSAQITKRYEPNQLVGRQVVAVVNFPPKQIANIKSQCLVLGGVSEDEDVVLLQPDQAVPNGTRIS